jgi:flavin reductase (DIM6/NTAB) family NADH-FMN oxidoreductase RutF
MAGEDRRGVGAFEAIADRVTYPMYVVTAASGGEADGCLVGFGSQCSIHPPRALICLSVANRTYRIARSASHLGVHLLDRGQRELAELFGSRTGDDTDKLAAVQWHPGPGGVPILSTAPAYFVGAVLDRILLGDHVGFLVEPVEGSCRDGDWDYVDFAAVSDLEPGHPA